MEIKIVGLIIIQKKCYEYFFHKLFSFREKKIQNIFINNAQFQPFLKTGRGESQWPNLTQIIFYDNTLILRVLGGKYFVERQLF